MKIISGGQTGADRAALDWAMANGFNHGGWCPKGRRAEDGIIPECYRLMETATSDYPERTKLNVQAADATVVISISQALGRGSQLTWDFANRIQKPVVHIHAQMDDPVGTLRAFLKKNSISVLNIAGSRLTSEPDIASFTKMVLDQAFRRIGNGCNP